MARNRMIKPKFWEDVKIAKITRDARLLYIGIWNFCDDVGVIPDNAIYIKSKVFPYDQIQIINFEKWLNELKINGFIYQFSYKDEDFIYLPNFLKHQRIDKPNYDELFVKKHDLNICLSTFQDESSIDRILIAAEVKESKEEVKLRKGKGEKTREALPFAPPVFDDVFIFFKENSPGPASASPPWNDIKCKSEAEAFMDYYSKTDWETKTGPITNWKSAASGWMRNDAKFQDERSVRKKTKFPDHYDKQLEMTLQNDELKSYWANLRALGWITKKDKFGKVIGWIKN